VETRLALQKILDTIDERIQTPLCLEELCRLAGYSLPQLGRLFRSLVGVSPHTYILRRRLLYAVYDIAGGSKGIDAALRFGFASYSGFYRAFVREFGSSPSAFIKAHAAARPYRINILQEEHIMIGQTQLKRVLACWNLQNETIQSVYRPSTGAKEENAYRVGERYVVKLSTNLAVLQKAQRLTAALKAAGVPVAETIPTADGRDFARDGEVYFFLSQRLQGAPLGSEALLRQADLARRVGAGIARLHGALLQLDGEGLDRMELMCDSLDELERVQTRTGLPESFVQEYGRAAPLLQRLPSQIIHRDLNPSNILFEGGELSGFVDFDLAAIGPRVFDLCYFATAVLSETLPRHRVERNQWDALVQNLLAGYESLEKLTDEEKQALPYVMLSNQVQAIAYFSKLDRYAHLAQTNIRMLRFLCGDD